MYDSIPGRIKDSIELVEQTSQLVRNVMADLRPPMLDDYGILSALNWYSRDFSIRTGIMAEVHGGELHPRPPGHVEIVLFRIVQEALNNVAKHAKAARFDIYITGSNKTICLSVIDDGIGFDPKNVIELNQSPHWGLLSMEEKAVSIGGKMMIDSKPGKGTHVSVEIEW
jgi:two-component system, NarL family, sensor histidine kinase UhpB